MAAGGLFRWMLWGFTEDYSCLQDEFVAHGFRFRLMGNGLELAIEHSEDRPADAARKLAEVYVETLSRFGVAHFSLITEEEFLERTAPPFRSQMTNVPVGRPERERVGRTVRDARNQVLASGDPWLRRCYDHLQNAREHAARAAAPDDKTAYHEAYLDHRGLGGAFRGREASRRCIGQDPSESQAGRKHEAPYSEEG